MKAFEHRVGILRDSIDASGRQDFARALEAMDEDVEVHLPPAFPGAGTARGHEGWLRLQAEFEEAFAGVDYEPEEFEQAGDRILVRIRYSGTARHTEIPIDVDVYWLYTFRGAKIRRMDVFLDREEATAAAGLSEPGE